jgi:methylmalonyl-CoA mutase N-terminal domain/subunit
MDDMAQTPSDVPVTAVCGPEDRHGGPPAPGGFPFTRNNIASGHRGKNWTFRQCSGFGTAEESYQRNTTVNCRDRQGIRAYLYVRVNKESSWHRAI